MFVYYYHIYYVCWTVLLDLQVRIIRSRFRIKPLRFLQRPCAHFILFVQPLCPKPKKSDTIFFFVCVLSGSTLSTSKNITWMSFDTWLLCELREDSVLCLQTSCRCEDATQLQILARVCWDLISQVVMFTLLVIFASSWSPCLALWCNLYNLSSIRFGHVIIDMLPSWVGMAHNRSCRDGITWAWIALAAFDCQPSYKTPAPIRV